MSPQIAHMVVQSFKTKNDSPLSEREVQVLQGITQGKSYAKLGLELYISRETVRGHNKSIYRKLPVNNRWAVLKIAGDKNGYGSGRIG